MPRQFALAGRTAQTLAERQPRYRTQDLSPGPQAAVIGIKVRRKLLQVRGLKRLRDTCCGNGKRCRAAEAPDLGHDAHRADIGRNVNPVRSTRGRKVDRLDGIQGRRTKGDGPRASAPRSSRAAACRPLPAARRPGCSHPGTDKPNLAHLKQGLIRADFSSEHSSF